MKYQKYKKDISYSSYILILSSIMLCNKSNTKEPFFFFYRETCSECQVQTLVQEVGLKYNKKGAGYSRSFDI